MVSIWKSLLIEQAAGWNLPRDARWGFLFHNNYQPGESYINLLWFHDGEAEPRVVTKLCRAPDVLAREFENMQQVYPACSGCMPRPLHFGKHGDFWTLWMTGVPGSRLSPDSATALRSVAETLVKIHLATRRPLSGFGPDRHRRTVLEPLRSLAEYGSATAVIEGCASLARDASSDWIATLPSIPQHGDLYSANLLFGKHGMYVLDWEVYGLVDLPACDLFTFLISPLMTNESLRQRGPGTVNGDVPPVCDFYAKSLGLSAADLRLLLPLTLANWFRNQLNDGHRAFADNLYRVADQYFRNQSGWETALLPPAP